MHLHGLHHRACSFLLEYIQYKARETLKPLNDAYNMNEKKKVLESEFSKEKKDKHWLLTWSIIVEFEKAHMQKSVPQRNGSWGQMLSETFFVS